MDDAYCSNCLKKMKKDWDKRTGKGYLLYTCSDCGYRQKASPQYVITNGDEVVPVKSKDEE